MKLAVVMMPFSDGRDDHYPRSAGRLKTGKLKIIKRFLPPKPPGEHVLGNKARKTFGGGIVGSGFCKRKKTFPGIKIGRGT